MYYTFFGLRQPPFRITPDTAIFFEGANRGSVLEALIYAIGQGEGIVKVTGEVGSGKTMLCRVLQQRLGTSVDIVYLANPNVPPDEILHAIAFELQLPVKRDATRLEVMHALQHFLVQRHAERRQVVVFVEESQGMPIATLEEIRLLSNLETDRHKLLQIVLFGQPELDENLRQNNIRQLRERITHSFYLSPLSPPEIAAYLSFRMHAAGYRGPEIFSKKVIAYISKASEGLTRRVNIIADKALLVAFAESTHTISLKHVRSAVQDSEFSQGNAPGIRPAWLGWALLGVAILIAATSAWWWFGRVAPYRDAQAVSSTSPSSAPKPPVPAVAQGLVAAPPTSASGSAVADADADAVRRLEHPPGDSTARSETVTPGADDGTALRIAAEISPPVPRNVTSMRPDRSSHALPVDFLERRLRATDSWLANAPEPTYTVQLMSSADPEYLKQYFNSLAKYIEIDHLFVYRTVANLKPSLTIVYGEYPTMRAADEAIEGLPPELQRFRPYQRTVRGIRAELEEAHLPSTAR
ncbi:MAG: AAA family ATPase [Betaproteobacteria bacterium]